MTSYRNACWGRGDDDVMVAAGGSAHSGCYLSRWLQKENTGKNLTNVTTTIAVLLQLQPLLLLLQVTGQLHLLDHTTSSITYASDSTT